MTRAPEQLALVLPFEAVALTAPAPARVVEAPPEGVEFITDEELDLIFGPRAEPRADVCTLLEARS